MASFGWKRKIGEKVSRATSQQFEAEAADEKGPGSDEDEDWVHATKRRKEVLLEDCIKKSKQLKDEGASLAENRRYREAIQRWDEALQLTPEDATLYEMKSQCELCSLLKKEPQLGSFTVSHCIHFLLFHSTFLFTLQWKIRLCTKLYTS